MDNLEHISSRVNSSIKDRTARFHNLPDLDLSLFAPQKYEEPLENWKANCFKVDPMRLESDLDRAPLVQRRITQNQFFFSLYSKDIKITSQKKDFDKKGGSLRGDIKGFSKASQRRLAFVARNAGDYINSQFCLTYHQTSPDGQTSKKHLNHWLTQIRQYYVGVKYLWVMEFQKRGVVHYHVFLSLKPTATSRRRLAKWWNTITEESRSHLKFHLNPKNFFDWEMRTGSYVAKYLQKMEQKQVPDNFDNCGRFWGNSKNITPEAYLFTMDDLLRWLPWATETDAIYIQKYFRRVIIKYYERILLKTSGHKKNKRRYHYSVNVPFGSKIFYQLLDYFSLHPPELVPF